MGTIGLDYLTACELNTSTSHMIHAFMHHIYTVTRAIFLLNEWATFVIILHRAT